jgi:tetratricopeptide (TPR) repeat protein
MLVVLVGSCAPTAQDRGRELTRDGLDLYRRGAFADARDTFRAALAVHPDDPDLLFHLARCTDRMGLAADAERQYRDCLQRDLDHADARHALAVLLVRRGRRDEAVKMAEEWLRERPELAGPYALDGHLCAEKGDLIRARARFQQALDRDPLDARAMVELGRVYERADRADRALWLYERSLAVNADQPEVRRWAEALRKKGTPPPQPD